jgi:hypothetical protein
MNPHHQRCNPTQPYYPVGLELGNETGMEKNAFMIYMQRQQTAQLPQGFNSLQRKICVTSHERRLNALAKHIPSSSFHANSNAFISGALSYGILISLVHHIRLIFCPFLFTIALPFNI